MWIASGTVMGNPEKPIGEFFFSFQFVNMVLKERFVENQVLKYCEIKNK